MGHEVSKPGGGETDVAQLTGKGLGFVDGEALTMRPPSGQEMVAEGGKEVLWGVYREAAGVNDMSQDSVNRANDHFLELIEGDGILPMIQGGGPQQYKDGLYTSGGRTFDADDIKPVDIYAVVDVDVMWCGCERAPGCAWWGDIWIPDCFGELSR
jgi:hypothetical protein